MTIARIRRGVAALAAIFVVASTFAYAAPTASAQSTDSPDLFGLATDANQRNQDLRAFRSEAGRAAAFDQIFWAVDSGWPQSGTAAVLNDVEAGGSTPFIEIVTSNSASTFDSFLSGGQDSNLAGMVTQIADWVNARSGRRVLVAPFPEANLAAFVWSNPSEFKAAYRKVQEAFAAEGLGPDEVRFVWWLNGVITGSIWQDYYPSDDEVDIIGFSKLNRNDPYRDYDDTFGTYIRAIQNNISRSKPILVAQTGSVDETGRRDDWLRDMFRNLDAEEQVIGAVYFNRNKFEGGKDNDYRILVDGQLDQVVIDEIDGWSDPSEVSWIFDGRMDRWEASRAEAVTGGFIDTLDSVFVEDIAWLSQSGITAGCNPPSNNRFCPDDRVTRGQMAAFLKRALDGEIPEGAPVSFSDTAGSVFALDIAWLARTGITTGCGDGKFCPNDHVTRGQMAAFLKRALDGEIPEGAPVSFSDTAGSVFALDIAWLARTGITTGCGDGKFCPREDVTRGQMAAFLRRALG